MSDDADCGEPHEKHSIAQSPKTPTPRSTNATGCRFVLKLELASKIIEAYVFGWNAPIVAHLQNGLVHQRRSTEVELNVLRCIVMRQLVFNDRVVNKTEETVPLVVHVFLHLPIVFLSRFRKHHVEIEIRELSCDFVKIVQVEQLAL